MSITVSCACGKQSRIAEKYAGRRIKCPACKKPIAVPDEDEPAPKRSDSLTTKQAVRSTPATFRIKCDECGKNFQVQADQVGKMIKCTECGLRQEIPDLAREDEEVEIRGRVRAGRPEARRNGVASRDAADEDDDFEKEKDRGGRFGKKKKKKSKLPLLLGVLAALLLLAGGGFAGWWFFMRGPDLAKFVPGDAEIFVSIRMADAWKVNATKDALASLKQIDPKYADLGSSMEKETGLKPEDVERITFIAEDADNKDKRWSVVSTLKPYDREKIKSNLTNVTTAKHEGKTYIVGKDKDGAKEAFYFASSRLFVEGSEEGLKRALSVAAGKPTKGPMDEPLKLAKGKAHLVIGYNFPAKKMKKFKDVLVGNLARLKAVGEVQSGTAVVNWGDQADIDLTLKFADDAKAKSGREALDNAVKMGKELLKIVFPQIKQSDDKTRKGVKSLQTALDSVKIDQKGAAVTASGRVESVAAIDGFAGLAAGPGGQGGGGEGGAGAVQSSNNLKQMALAFHNYAANTAYALMPRNIFHPISRKPLLSWRVAILPYIDQGALYKQFKLDEPWDSAHNIKLVSKMPRIYALPGDTQNAPKGFTPYVVFTGATAPFKEEIGGTSLNGGFVDGMSKTLLIVEGSRMVQWSKPGDIVYNPRQSPKPFLRKTKDGYLVVTADCAIRQLKPTISDKTLHAAITVAGGELLGPDW
jgi:hypothetical protein